ncbi:EthD family reductase [Cognatazoarcus halotolerans]|uniref:EthD family reductase n=1 Tax=Cognatazoarcus halotolerans TaxID=2686016 RepID=UPI0013568923|nr:EthD family reductase [Cognatazoarcus halotolerans]
MIKVSVMYKNAAGCRFDMDYYCKTHIPMVRDRLGAACKGIAVDKGLSGEEPGSSPSYIAMGHLFFDSPEAFQASFGPQAEVILADVPNYTDAEIVLQMSEVMINASRSEAGELRLHGG